MEIKKIKLSEKIIYHGEVKMPEGFELDNSSFVKDIFLSQFYKNYKAPANIEQQRLHTYINEFINLKFKINLISLNSYGLFFEKNEKSKTILEINRLNLHESPDYVMLYGVEIDDKSCIINIKYDDNRRVNRSWDIPLLKNKFIIFPASQEYTINNEGNKYLNFVKITNFIYI
jgi:hypothetical protein